MVHESTSVRWAVGALAASILLVCGKATSHVMADSRGGTSLTAAEAFKSNQMAEFAYQTGCFEAYVKACGYIDDDEPRSECYREGLRGCGGSAKHFRSWIENGRRR